MHGRVDVPLGHTDSGSKVTDSGPESARRGWKNKNPGQVMQLSTVLASPQRIKEVTFNEENIQKKACRMEEGCF